MCTHYALSPSSLVISSQVYYGPVILKNTTLTTPFPTSFPTSVPSHAFSLPVGYRHAVNVDGVSET